MENLCIEKTFREVILGIKEGEVWDSVQSCFQLKEISCENGRINFKLVGVLIDKNNNNSIFTGSGAGQTFKLKRKEFTFKEAFEAYEEGKEIESLVSFYKYKKISGKDFCFSASDLLVDKCLAGNSIEIDELRGKWYINN